MTTTEAPSGASADVQPEAEPTETKPAPVAEEPGQEVELARGNAAITAAADAALAFPGVPGRDEFLSLAMQARMLSLSGAAPELVRDNPFLAFHVAMVGRDLGISPSAALELIDVINTNKGPRLSLSPQLLNGQIRRLGLGSIVPVVRTSERCVAVALRPHGLVDHRCAATWPTHDDDCQCVGIIGDSEFTWADAQEAGLAGKNCQPGEHKKNTDGRCPCKQGYQTYSKRMLWWRAGGFAADDFFPEAGLGLYSPEELGAVVDAEGRPIDPSTVDLPEGYEPKGQRGGGDDETGEAADPETLWELQERVLALPQAQRADLRDRWGHMKKLNGLTLFQLPTSRLKLVDSLVRGVEGQAKAQGGWDPETAVVPVRLAWTWTAAALQCGALALGLPPEPTGGPESEETPAAAPEQPEGGERAQEAQQEPDPAPADGPASDAVVVERIIAEVKAMKFAEVTAALKDAEVDVTGMGPKDQRRTLAERRVRETLGERADG